MRMPDNRKLVVIVVVISALGIVVGQMQNFLSMETARLAGYGLFLVNIVTAVAGILAGHRLAWSIYLVASVICMVAIGEPTPLAAAWTLIVVLLHSLVS